MKIANFENRPHVVSDDGKTMVAAATLVGPEFSDFKNLYDNWDDFLTRAHAAQFGAAPQLPVNESLLGSPSPTPRQLFAVGLNYRAHAAESGLSVPDTLPPIFTKFVSSLSGPNTDVRLPDGGNTDWEAELVVVIGRGARNVSENDAWRHVAGLAIGQDISERITQLRGPVPQFSLGKSFAGFAPVGPWLVTPDEFADPDDIALGCAIDGETVQDSRTSNLVFSVPTLISKVSTVLELLPGDIIFTGTPDGVGLGRDPQRFLRPGEELTTWAEGIGELHQRFTSTESASRAS